jgi:hypothetical protein
MSKGEKNSNNLDFSLVSVYSFLCSPAHPSPTPAMDKIQKQLDDLERKATKSNKIVVKGDKMGLKDAIKLGQKGNSIVSTIKKNIKDYEVCRYFPPLSQAYKNVGKLVLKSYI